MSNTKPPYQEVEAELKQIEVHVSPGLLWLPEECLLAIVGHHLQFREEHPSGVFTSEYELGRAGVLEMIIVVSHVFSPEVHVAYKSEVLKHHRYH